MKASSSLAEEVEKAARCAGAGGRELSYGGIFKSLPPSLVCLESSKTSDADADASSSFARMTWRSYMLQRERVAGPRPSCACASAAAAASSGRLLASRRLLVCNKNRGAHYADEHASRTKMHGEEMKPLAAGSTSNGFEERKWNTVEETLHEAWQ